MDTQRALEQLRGRLETSFGKALAMLILASACNDADVSMVGLTPDQYGRLVEAVSRDQRVVGELRQLFGSVALGQEHQVNAVRRGPVGEQR